jgi:hypothetical protein
MKKVTRNYTIGRRAFAKISAVEGVRLTQELSKDFQAFERNNLSHEDRRQVIVKKYSR